MTKTVKTAMPRVAVRESVTQKGNPSHVVAVASGGRYQGTAAANKAA